MCDIKQKITERIHNNDSEIRVLEKEISNVFSMPGLSMPDKIDSQNASIKKRYMLRLENKTLLSILLEDC